MRFLRFLAVVIMAALCSVADAQDLGQLMRSRNEYYFTVTVDDLKEVKLINDVVSVDKVEGNVVTCYANNRQFEQLVAMGYEVSLQTPPSMQYEQPMYDGTNRESYDWDTYPTYDAYESMMNDFVTEHPDKCSLLDLGTLNSGRKILVARLNNGQTEGKPRFLYTSTMHGDEVTGMMLMLRLIDYLLTTNDERVNAIIDNIDLFICPNANPDGTYHSGNHTMNGATRYNANGVDLNRNYADPEDGPHPDGEDYQPETVMFMQLAEDYHFVMGANYHGGAEVMNYPWDTWSVPHADNDWYVMVSREYADNCHAVNANYMTDLNNGITNGYAWYTIDGSRQDYMNYFASCRELTIECSTIKMPQANTMPTYWNINLESMLSFLEQVNYGVRGVVTDEVTGAPIEAVVTITGHDINNSEVSSGSVSGDFYRPLKAGTYTLLYTASGYLPETRTVTVADYQSVVQDVAMTSGEGIVADFAANNTSVGIGSTVNFEDKSWGANIVSWEWSFEGATPVTSTQQNPTGISYSELGSYDVTLTVTNSSGATSTVTKENYITVSEIYNMQNGTYTTCNGLFFDSGGASGRYGNNENYTMTFVPATEGVMLQAEFVSFAVEPGYDFLDIYDGTSTSATQIGHYSGSDSPGIVTATNAQGALTFRFTSDYSTTGEGWYALVTCLSDNEPLEIIVTAEPSQIVAGESSQLNVQCVGGTGNYTYSWSPAESLDDATIANPMATPSQTTTYHVTVSDGESEVKGDVTVSVTLNAIEYENDEVKIYPNPAKDVIFVEYNADIKSAKVGIYNELGQECHIPITQEGSNRVQIKVSALPEGIYVIRIAGADRDVVRRVVVQ